MRYLLVLTLALAACTATDDAPAAPTTAEVAVTYCVGLCGWADKCGGFYPEACGELCSPLRDCLDTCIADVCARPGNDCDGGDAPLDQVELEECVSGQLAATRDCTSTRPDIPACVALVGDQP
jgi:hypothetical protein